MGWVGSKLDQEFDPTQFFDPRKISWPKIWPKQNQKTQNPTQILTQLSSIAFKTQFDYVPTSIKSNVILKALPIFALCEDFPSPTLGLYLLTHSLAWWENDPQWWWGVPTNWSSCFLPSFQLNSETLKTFCTRNHHLEFFSAIFAMAWWVLFFVFLIIILQMLCTKVQI